MLCGSWWEVSKNRLFQWGHLRIPVSFNVKFHIKKSVSPSFPYMLYISGEVTSKPGQTSKTNFSIKK